MPEVIISNELLSIKFQPLQDLHLTRHILMDGKVQHTHVAPFLETHMDNLEMSLSSATKRLFNETYPE